MRFPSGIFSFGSYDVKLVKRAGQAPTKKRRGGAEAKAGEGHGGRRSVRLRGARSGNGNAGRLGQGGAGGGLCQGADTDGLDWLRAAASGDALIDAVIENDAHRFLILTTVHKVPL